MNTCSIDDCERTRKARGFCDTHWQRWRKYGDARHPVKLYARDPEEAFEARTEPLVWTDCIVWTGYTTTGYGSLRVNGKHMLAHRYAWERANGPIPDGMVIDHTCWERMCVNVDHLRLATRAQNNRYRNGANPGRDLPRGVTRNGRKYVAQVTLERRNHYLGLHDTPEAASMAADQFRRINFGIFAGNA
ncbi:HNH endonuclease signature motif containing protein [Pseudactinotalea sp.]|uniref:HNH endonuclease signature motif containing protein n=1 Tax=Pseudactinotalea sp. TaxID=1926260 RepID=UPI003B3A6C56